MDIVVPIVGGLLAVGVVWIIVIRHRIGVLNAASRLVILGAVVVAFEHPQFAITLSARVIYPEAQNFVFHDHARLHFFMAGVYTLIGLVVIGVVARTLLREGRRAGWLIVLGALVVGGGLDLIVGGFGSRTALRYTRRSTFKETDSVGRFSTSTSSPGSPPSSSTTAPYSARPPFRAEQGPGSMAQYQHNESSSEMQQPVG